MVLEFVLKYSRRNWRNKAALGMAVVWAVFAHAQQDDAASWLRSVGYPPENCHLLLSWQEYAGGRLVTGYHLQHEDGSTMDVYRDGDMLIADADRRRLGIVTKHWGPISEERPTLLRDPGNKDLPQAVPDELKLTPEELSALPMIALVPSETDKLLSEDAIRAQSGEKSLWRAGVYRTLPMPIEPSLFHPLSAAHRTAASLSGLRVSIPGAVGMRLYIAAYAQAAAQSIYLLGKNAGVIEKLETAPEEGYWASTIYDDTVAIVLSETDASASESGLIIPALIEMYRNPFEAAKTNPGFCNLDASCYPEWNTAGSGVAVLGTAGPFGALFCTGTLIADASDCIDIPLLLTANHCVGTQAKANTLEFYWDYASSQCNGPAPNINSVPKTGGGAILLATQSGNGFTGGGNDFTLLRMNNQPPAGNARLGWSTQPQTAGTSVVSLHHPRLSYRRFASGEITSAGNLFPQYFHQVHWAQGTTEPGSSGCALLRADTQQIIGQLWGGNASCFFTDAPDYFGRFDLTYAIIAPFLNPDPVAGFAVLTQSIIENVGTLDISVQLVTPAPPGGISMSFQHSGGTATPVNDFTPQSGNFRIEAGETSGSFSLGILNNTHTATDKTIEITLAPGAPSCVQIDPSRAVLVVTILDDDADSDGDGLSDFDEINGVFGFITDPTKQDTDGDGLSDFEELMQTFGHFLNPTNRDTDGDGYGDYTEILLGSNPAVMDGHLLDTLTLPWFR